MGFFSWLGNKRPSHMGQEGRHNGYFLLDDAPASAFAPDDDDDALENIRHIDAAAAQSAACDDSRAEQRWYHPSFWRGRSVFWWSIRLSAAALGVFFLLFAFLLVTAPLSKSLEPIAPPRVTLLAADGTPIARSGAIIDQPVKISELPPHVVDAFLSIEDRRFYSHWGIDPRGLARAAFMGVGGGSTITQQLAKFTFLSPERTLKRKAREALIAFWLEAWLSKNEILERYLSNVYFGDNVYGIRAASMHFFYRKPENLTLAQSAMLAGMVQAPSRFNPRQNYAATKKRMQMVLNAMVANGKLSRAAADRLAPPQIDHRAGRALPSGTYFADWALPYVRALTENTYGEQEVKTTLDARLQAAAERAIRAYNVPGAQAALVAMRKNGEVVAMVGGRSYAQSPFNRASQARRQPGSTFKTFVYLAALRQGMRADDLVDNSPIGQGPYRPKNANDRYGPPLTLEDAFARSSNVAAVRIFNRVGDKAVIEMARDLGISSPLRENDPSLALGTSGVTLIELTAAYAGIAANRFPAVPTPFQAEQEGVFDWIWNGKSSLSSSVHETAETMLRAVINRGTGRAARLPVANFGKTGTTQDNRDALFIGYAGDLVVGVWVGKDDNTSLGKINGGTVPARIWRSFMQEGLKLKPRKGRVQQAATAKSDQDDGAPTVPDNSNGALPPDAPGAAANGADDAQGASLPVSDSPILSRNSGIAPAPAPAQN